MDFLNANNCIGEHFLEGTKDMVILLEGQPNDRTLALFRTDLGAIGVKMNNKTESGLANYNFVKTSLTANNVMLYEVEVRCNDVEQLLRPIQIYELDISGDAKTIPLIPTFNPEQKLNNRLRINFIDNLKKPYILDGLTALLITQKAQIDITMVFKYKQVLNKELIYKSAFKEEYDKIKALMNLLDGVSMMDFKNCD